MPSLRSLLVASLAVAASPALLAVAPSHAAELTCTGSNGVINTPGGTGTACGTLNVGDTFRINLLPYINTIVNNPNAFNAIGAAISQGFGDVSFAGVGVIATGTVNIGGGPFTITNSPIALWGSSPVVATSDEVSSFTATSFFAPLNSFRTAAFTLSPTNGTASVGGLLASAAQVGLSNPTQFDLVGTYLGGGSANTKINFGLATFANLGFAGPGPTNPIATAPSSPNFVDFSTATFNGGNFSVVPGPLPLAGAGAAFAWSRTLRRRIKASKVSASN